MMKDDARLLVLTENTLLFEGLNALLPELDCHHMRFGVSQLPWKDEGMTGLIIAVDDQIFLQGGWAAFVTLLATAPDASVVWLAGRNATAGSLPSEDEARQVLSYGLDVWGVRRRILAQKFRPVKRIERGFSLTEREQLLLPIMMANVGVSLLARLTGCSEKTLYHHRRKIMTKMGFRQICFLQCIYKRNGGIPQLTATKPKNGSMTVDSDAA